MELSTISEEELSQLLLQRKNIQPRFRWMCSEIEAQRILMAAYKAEVMARRMQFRDEPTTLKYIKPVVKSLTAKQPKLGIMLCGTCGNGKTTMLLAIRTATNQLRDWQLVEGTLPIEVRIYDAREIAEDSKDVNNLRAYKQMNILAIEDMGKESAEVLNYGNSINPIMEIIEARYAWQKYTLITTNLTASQIREKYGDRIADRFNEMLDVVVFDDGSYRRFGR